MFQSDSNAPSKKVQRNILEAPKNALDSVSRGLSNMRLQSPSKKNKENDPSNLALATPPRTSLPITPNRSGSPIRKLPSVPGLVQDQTEIEVIRDLSREEMEMIQKPEHKRLAALSQVCQCCPVPGSWLTFQTFWTITLIYSSI